MNSSFETEKYFAQIRETLGQNLPSVSLMERYRPQKEWFAREHDYYGGLHGIGHAARVWVWQEILSGLLLLDNPDLSLDREALRWSAAIHDVRRITDGIEIDHGFNAAIWANTTMRDSIPSASLKTVSDSVTWHAPQDFQAPEMPPHLAILKDADGLDRVRLGDLNSKFLRHNYSKSLLIAPALALFELSVTRRIPFGNFETVMDAAAVLGLLEDK